MDSKTKLCGFKQMIDIYVCLLLFSSAYCVNEDPFMFRPQNNAVIYGKGVTTRFDCQHVDGLYQWAESTQVRTRSLTFQGELYPAIKEEGYSLNTDGGAYNLTVPVDRLEKAGQYSCKESYAILVTLESDPICTVNMSRVSQENEVIHYTCELGYRGTLSPKMRWMNKDGRTPKAKFIDQSVVGKIVKLTMEVRATLDKIGDIYVCDTFFEAPVDHDARDFAKNTPEYQHHFEAETLIIQPILKERPPVEKETPDDDHIHFHDDDGWFDDDYFNANNYVVFGIGAGVGLLIGIICSLLGMCICRRCRNKNKNYYNRVSVHKS